MNPSRTEAQEHARVDRYVQRYADDPLKHRLLMRLYSGRSNQTIAELSEPLRVHPSQVRKSLRMLILDGVVGERGDTGTKTYSLSSNPSARWLVSALLRRAIELGGTA
jgi:hypothetical protein